jgi:isopropylmalate/homocitrate/citramalate synthase
VAAGATEVAVFGAASETFSQKNINCSIAESMERFARCRSGPKKIGCAGRYPAPWAAPTGGGPPAAVACRARCWSWGATRFPGDTIGVGTPGKAQAMVDAVADKAPGDWRSISTIPMDRLANIRATSNGDLHIDSSVAGLGAVPMPVPPATGPAGSSTC